MKHGHTGLLSPRHSSARDMFHSYDYGFTLVTMTNTETQIFAIYKAMYTAIKNYITLNVKENVLMESLHVFPNPTANNFTVKFDSETKNSKLVLIDHTGKIVRSSSSLQTQIMEVNTSDLPSGIYTLKIQSEDYVWTKKMVVTR